jgi:hypothetical protein
MNKMLEKLGELQTSIHNTDESNKYHEGDGDNEMTGSDSEELLELEELSC